MDVNKLHCPTCSRSFDASKEQQDLIIKLRQNDAALVMLKCPNCWTSFGLDLKEKNDTSETEFIFQCPVSRCSGLVCFLEDSENQINSAWACGNCGSYWNDKLALQNEIRSSVNRFPYRSIFYTNLSSEIMPSNIDMDQKILDLIEQEPDDNAPDFRRG